ncbi:RE1-silencing transcription factor isoform X2 [Antennarius striatus]|uniref:RE1-silencing transcription factor isoform X2 n=1 Tax=Antennarius striatus TaxID=241820 RepID=UPI0035B45365
MAAQTVFSVGMFPVGVPLTDDAPCLTDAPGNTLPAPQLVMLANVAAVTAAEGGASGADVNGGDEKEMMELKTVGCSYSDSEDESVIRSASDWPSSYDNHNQREFCIIEYPESPAPPVEAVVAGNQEENRDKAEDLTRDAKPRPTTAAAKAPELDPKRKDPPVGGGGVEGAKRKKTFACKPCHFQAQNEQEFVQHLSSHSVTKMMVVNRVEGRSRTRSKDAEAAEAPAAEGGGGEAAAGDVKGLIRCERCGYNTNRYDHYIAHLKHHSKEGNDHRVFKCTLCPYTTVSQYHWRKHLRNHFPSKLHTCSQCSYFSDRKSNYIQHIRTHTGVRPFQCLYCDYSSSQKTHLTRHMRTHSGERPFKCESCNYLAANQHEVTRHARQVHNGPKPLSCPYCEYKTADRSNFKKHVELHLNPRQFLCPLCKYAASKKCNLKYHIKSRHSGCNVAMDISKVKLRVKKPGPDNAEENSRAGKFESSSNVDEDFDMDEDNEDQGVESSPINLSIRKSNRPTAGQQVPNESSEKVQKKTNATMAEKEKVPKVKELEKKVSTRQKRIEKVSVQENNSVKDVQTQTTTVNTDKAKRRLKKTERKQAEGTESEERQNPEEEGEEKPKEEEKSRPEKDSKKSESNGKENKSLNKPRKSGSKKSVKTAELAQEAPQKPEEKIKNVKVVKDKAAKRKSVEALDLSKKSSQTLSKAKRQKTTAAEKPSSKPPSEDSKKVDEATPTAPQTNEAAPVKQKKTRNASRKAAADPVQAETTSVKTSSAGAPEGSTHRTKPERQQPENILVKGASTDETSPATLRNVVVTSPEKMEVSSGGPSNEETPPPAEDQPQPTFVKPTSPPPLVLPAQQNKPADLEDDEGIHSSHEGGSDISDSSSEGSEDSGLNSAGSGSGKMANDPETPTDEIPTPTELKSHMCIFCDRTFPLEEAYRRHLNRHLVNVYYMDQTANNQAKT